MQENPKTALQPVSDLLKQLPDKVAAAAIDRFADRMEGFAEGFIAGQAHAKTENQ